MPGDGRGFCFYETQSAYVLYSAQGLLRGESKKMAIMFRFWRFRAPFEQPKNGGFVLWKQKSEFTRGGFNSDRVVVDPVGKQGEKAPGARFLCRA